MKRDIARIRRSGGLSTFTRPLFLLLAVLIVFSVYISDYFIHLDESVDLERRRDVVKLTLDLAKKNEISYLRLKSKFSEVESRSFRYKNVEESHESMKEQLREILSSLYFENLSFTKILPVGNDKSTPLLIDGHFTGVPQQLPRLELALLANTRAIRITKLQISVIDDQIGEGKVLDIKASFLGLHIKSD